MSFGSLASLLMDLAINQNSKNKVAPMPSIIEKKGSTNIDRINAAAKPAAKAMSLVVIRRAFGDSAGGGPGRISVTSSGSSLAPARWMHSSAAVLEKPRSPGNVSGVSNIAPQAGH